MVLDNTFIASWHNDKYKAIAKQQEGNILCLGKKHSFKF